MLIPADGAKRTGSPRVESAFGVMVHTVLRFAHLPVNNHRKTITCRCTGHSSTRNNVGKGAGKRLARTSGIPRKNRPA